jgi:hypothetical protein
MVFGTVQSGPERVRWFTTTSGFSALSIVSLMVLYRLRANGFIERWGRPHSRPCYGGSDYAARPREKKVLVDGEMRMHDEPWSVAREQAAGRTLGQSCQSIVVAV